MPTYAVDVSDNGPNSIRQALTRPEDAGQFVLNVTAGLGPLNLSSGLGVVAHGGPGHYELVINGNGVSINGSDVFATFTGAVRLHDLTLNSEVRIGDGGTSGTLLGDLHFNSKIVFNRSDDFTYAGVLSGVGSFLKEGAGTLTLTGASTFMADAVINQGAVVVDDADGLAAASLVEIGVDGAVKFTGQNNHINNLYGAGNLAIAGGQLSLFQNVGGNLSGVISGSGSFSKSGAGSLTLSGANTWTNSISITDGDLIVIGGHVLDDEASIDIASSGRLVLNAAETVGRIQGDGVIALGAHELTVNMSADGDFAGSIREAGGLRKIGVGALSLNGHNTHRGGTFVDGGELTVSAGAGVTDVLSDDGMVTIAAGAKFSLASDETIGALAGSGRVDVGSAILTLASDSDSSFAGRLLGDPVGGLIKSGAGRLTLTGNNDLLGLTTVAAGELEVRGGSAISNSSKVVIATGAKLIVSASEIVGEIDGAGSIVIADGVLAVNQTSTGEFAGVISGSGGFRKASTASLTLKGANTFTGDVEITGGALRLDSGAAVDDAALVTVGAGASLAINTDETIGAITGAGDIALASDLTIAGSRSTTFSGDVSASSGAPNAALIFDGSGELTITQTLSADALVKSGALVVDGGAGKITVQGGVLRGSGSATFVEVQSGAKFSAGASAGSFTVDDLTLHAGATVVQEFLTNGAGHFDQIIVDGGVDLNGATLDIDLLGGATLAFGTFVIIDNKGSHAVTGAFNGLAEGDVFTAANTWWKISYAGGDGNDVALTHLASPAPDPDPEPEPEPEQPAFTAPQIRDAFAVAAGFAPNSSKALVSNITLPDGTVVANPSFETAVRLAALIASFQSGVIGRDALIDGVVALSAPTAGVALQASVGLPATSSRPLGFARRGRARSCPRPNDPSRRWPEKF